MGLFAVLVSFLFFLLSFWVLQKGNKKLSLLLLLAGGLVLRVYSSSYNYLGEWDERYHALVAKNLIKHPLKPTLYDNPILPFDKMDWSSNHIWLSKPIVPLWFISASIYLFGNNEFSVRIPSLIFSTLCILLTFFISRKLFNEKIAWLATFLHAIHGLLVEVAAGKVSSDHVETSFLFFTQLSILLCLIASAQPDRKKYLFLCGISAGLAVLSKFLPGLLVLIIYPTITFVQKKSAKEILFGTLIISSSIVVTVLPWFIYCYTTFPNEFEIIKTSLFYPMHHVVQYHSASWWYYLEQIRIIFGEIIYIPIIWLLYFLFYKKVINISNIFLLVWIFIPVLVFSLSSTKRFTYILISAPAFFILSSIFYFYLKEKVSTLKSVPYKAIAYIVLLLIILLPMRYSLERLKPFDEKEKNPKWVIQLKQYNTIGNNAILFNYERPIEAMFYTNFTAYAQLPTMQYIDSLSAKGYEIYINNNGNLPENIMKNKNINIVDLP